MSAFTIFGKRIGWFLFVVWRVFSIAEIFGWQSGVQPIAEQGMMLLVCGESLIATGFLCNRPLF